MSTSVPLGRTLGRAFYDRPVLVVARDLLGRVVRHVTPDGAVSVRLTEVEAYAGQGEDPGSHAHRGPTPRNAAMFGPPGHAYVYFTYGMHWCLNLVCGRPGSAAAVLLRAGEVVEGEQLARLRRPASRYHNDLARGPARLAAALGVDGALDRTDVCAPGSVLTVHVGRPFGDVDLGVGPRVGVSGEGAPTPWRLYVEGSHTVSRWRPGGRGARAATTRRARG